MCVWIADAKSQTRSALEALWRCGTFNGSGCYGKLVRVSSSDNEVNRTKSENTHRKHLRGMNGGVRLPLGVGREGLNAALTDEPWSSPRRHSFISLCVWTRCYYRCGLACPVCVNHCQELLTYTRDVSTHPIPISRLHRPVSLRAGVYF